MMGKKTIVLYMKMFGNKYKCKDCAMFASEGSDSASYCLAKDFYTFVMSDDDACDEFVK